MSPIYCGFYYRSGVLSPRIPWFQIIEDDVYNETQKLMIMRFLYIILDNWFHFLFIYYQYALVLHPAEFTG